MRCPFCNHPDDKVLETRVQQDGESIRRRRECLECKSRFSTLETLVLSFPSVIKKDGRREPFSKEKLSRGIQAACQKRPVSLAQIEEIVETVSRWILEQGEVEISSESIGQKVIVSLRALDSVAYVRFASVYRTFKDIDEFVATLEDEGQRRPVPFTTTVE